MYETGRQLAELETAAWKDDRRFRILTLDNGTTSFADLFFHSPTKRPSSAGTGLCLKPYIGHAACGE